MFRNQYDTDVTVWSPQGRLHQVEYATEAVNQVRFFSFFSCSFILLTLYGIYQGTICLGLRSSEYVVLVALNRSPNELASYQKKLFKIDEHLCMGMSGITADGRSLAK